MYAHGNHLPTLEKGREESRGEGRGGVREGEKEYCRAESSTVHMAKCMSTLEKRRGEGILERGNKGREWEEGRGGEREGGIMRERGEESVQEAGFCFLIHIRHIIWVWVRNSATAIRK